MNGDHEINGKTVAAAGLSCEVAAESRVGESPGSGNYLLSKSE